MTEPRRRNGGGNGLDILDNNLKEDDGEGPSYQKNEVNNEMVCNQTNRRGERSGSPPINRANSPGVEEVIEIEEDFQGSRIAEDPDVDRLSVIAGSVANLCSATLGAGILSVPHAFYQAGVLAALTILAGTAYSTVASIHILTLCSSSANISSYEKLVEVKLGTKARRFVEFCVLIFCSGTAVAYCIAVGDILEMSGILSLVTNSIPKLSWWLLSARITAMIAVWTIIMFPLSSMRTMRGLQFSSVVGMISIATLVLATMWHLVEDARTNGGSNVTNLMTNKPTPTNSILWPSNGFMSILTSCPIILFSFACQVNVCAIYAELPFFRSPATDNIDQDRTFIKLSAMKTVTRSAVGICAMLYLTISACVLADFGSEVKPNVLNNYRPPVGVMQIATVAVALAVVLAFPLNIFPARETLLGMLARRRRASGHSEGDDNNEELGQDVPYQSIGDESTERAAPPTPEHSETPSSLHYVLTLLLAGSALFLACILPNISIVFGFVGGTAASVLGFIIPGALGLDLARSQDQELQQSFQNIWLRKTSWFLMVGGIVVGVVTTGATLVDYQ